MSVNTNDYANQLLAENQQLKRERDELRAEISRHDAAAGESVKAVVKHYAGCKYPLIKVNSLEVVIAGEREDAEELADFINTIGAQPAVLPPEMDSELVPEGYNCAPYHYTDGYNQCRADALTLGAQPQKPVVLSEIIRHELIDVLTWIERLPVPTKSAAAKAIRLRKAINDIDAANVPYEVEK